MQIIWGCAVRLDELARDTAKFALKAFEALYPDPALVFLSALSRPPGNLAEALSAATPARAFPGSTAATTKVAGAKLDLGKTQADGVLQLPEVREVTKGSLVLVLKKRTRATVEGIVLGRAPGHDYCLPASTVSRAHARFVSTPRGWTVTDLGSSNGTFVDGRRLEPHAPEVLVDGALVAFGADTQAKFFTTVALHGLLKLHRSGVL